MVVRNPVRLAAPLALCAVLLALVVVVANSGGGSTPAVANPEATTTVPSGKAKARKHKPRKTYVVHSGDTLAQIADKTGLTVDELLALNPDVDPQALQVDERLKLR